MNRSRLLPLLLLLAVAPTLQAAPDGLELARKRWLDAKAAERQAVEAIATAGKAAAAKAKRISARAADRSRFEAWQAKEDRLRGEIVRLYEKRVKVALAPEVELQRMRELERQWKILAPVRRHLAPGFWKALDGELRKLKQASKTRGAESKRKQKAVDREIAAARKKLARHREGLGEAIVIRTGFREMAEWAVALADVERKRADAEAKGEAVLQAFDAYLKVARDVSPPHLKVVELSAGGSTLYRGAWSDAGADSPADDLKRRELDGIADELRARAIEIEARRRELAKERLPMAQKMHREGKGLEPLAKEYGDALFDKVLAEAIIESATVIVEVALTGGAATAARKGTELAEKLAEAGAKRALRRTGKSLGKLDEALLRRAGNRASSKVLDEALELRRIWRSRYVKEAVEEAKASARLLGKSEHAAAKAAKEAAEKSLRRLEKDARKLALARDKVAKARDRARKALENAPDEEAVAAMRTSLLSKGPAKPLAAGAMAAGAGGWTEGTGLSAGGKAFAQTLTGEAIESVLANMGTSTLSGIYKGAKEAAGDGAWKAIKGGTRGLAGRFKLSAVKETFGTKANLIGLGGSLAKAAASAHYAQKASDAHTKFWELYGKLAIQYELYKQQLKIDRDLFRRRNKAMKAYAKIARFLSHDGEKRRLERKPDAPLRKREGAIGVKLSFSSDLVKAPVVRLGGVPVPVTGGPRGWSGKLDASRLPAGGEAALTVEAPPGLRPFPSLDADPSTPSYRPPEAAVWLFWERGPDKTHRLKLDASESQSESEAGGRGSLVDRGKFTRVYRRKLPQVNDAPAKIEPDSIPAGKGLLRVLSRDATGKLVARHVRARTPGAKADLASGWGDLHLPPGGYLAHIEGFLPALPLRSTRVSAGGVSVLRTPPLGRLRRITRDGLGADFASHITVRIAGSKTDLLGTWAATVDLPPGRYDVILNGYNPLVRHDGVEVRAGQETTVLAEGYGRLSSLAYDGLDREIDTHWTIRARGAKDLLAGTWQKSYDVPPGAYTIVFDQYVPPITRTAQVRPEQATLVTARGYGRLSTRARDGLGKEIDTHWVIRRTGEKNALGGTWARTFDVPPGSYEVTFDQFVPNMVRTARVLPKKATELVADGYGRLRTRALDGLGKAIDTHWVIRRAGEKAALGGTWGKTFDVPPGSYDLTFDQFTPPIVRKGVRVTRHAESLVTASGYGRLRLTLTNAAGKPGSAHVSIYRAGARSALVGSWQPQFDLPPGRWELRLDGWDEETRRGFSIRAGSQTNLALRVP